MAATVWKGYISFGLGVVSCAAYLGRTSRDGAFSHAPQEGSLAGERGLVLRQEDKQIDRSDIVKGYETSKGAYVVVEERTEKNSACDRDYHGYPAVRGQR